MKRRPDARHSNLVELGVLTEPTGTTQFAVRLCDNLMPALSYDAHEFYRPPSVHKSGPLGSEALLRRRNQMRKTLVAGSALAGGLLMSTLVWGSAQATSAPDLKDALVSLSSVTLVGRGGGGGIWAEWVVAASEEWVAATLPAVMSWAVAEVAPSAAVR